MCAWCGLPEDDGVGTIYGTYTAYNGYQRIPVAIHIQRPQDHRKPHHGGQVCEEQGHGPVPAPDQWKLRHVRAAGRREPLHHGIRQRARLEPGTSVRDPEVLVGVLDHRQLRVARRNPGGLVDADARGRSDAAVCHRRDAARSREPAKVIGRSAEPIIVPAEDERVGYVPNVVYTCGAMLHNDSLIIPYALGDVTTTFACVQVDELIASLKRG
jgi:hypothetical protein